MKKDESRRPLLFEGGTESVLVTGATGFIGQQLVRALLADGHQVTILSRNPKQATKLFEGRTIGVRSMNELPPTHSIDVIINLAGARVLGWRWTATRQAVLRQSRIGLTESIIAWIGRAQTKPRLLLSASAIGYYGTQKPGDETSITEAGATQPVFMSQLCQEWEATAHQAAAYGVQVSCMRFGVVLGQQGALPMMLLPIKLGLGGRLGSGKQWLSWIHVHDVVRGIAHLFNREAHMDADAGAYNFVAPEVVSQHQFSQIAAHVIHRPCFFPTPAWPMRLMLGEQADLLLEGQRVVPARLLSQGFTFTYGDVGSALKSLL